MKKIISMLLVLTMIMTTLMGAMIVDVNAGVEYEINNDATPRNLTLTYTATSTKSRNFMATGSYTLVPQTQAEGGQASYDLGEVSLTNSFGMEGYRFEFNGFTFKNGTKGNSSSYVKLHTAYGDTAPGRTSPSTSNRFAENSGSISVQDGSAIIGGDGTTANGKILKYTFYAYTKSQDTYPLTVTLMNGSSAIRSVTIAGDNLYSPKGIPHKVDVYVWSDSKDATVFGSEGGNANEYVYIATVIDGNRVSSASYTRRNETGYGMTTINSNLLNLAVLYELTQANTTEFTVTETDSYVFNPYAENGWVQVDRANVANEMFKGFNIGTNSTTVSSTDKTGFVVGFGKDGRYNEALEESLTSTVAGEDIAVNIYAKDYNSPSLIYDNYDASNVKVVDLNGKILTSVELAGLTSLNNHYFIINGVYVVPKMVDDPKAYAEGSVVFSSPSHNNVNTRIWHEDYVKNDMPEGSRPFGGLTEGFYRYSNEPLSATSYNPEPNTNNGFVKALEYTGGTDTSCTKAAYKIASYENVEKNIVTAEFDIYIPKHESSGFYIKTGFMNPELNSYSGNDTNIYLTTNGLGPAASNQNLNTIDLNGDSWNTVSLQYDLENPDADNHYGYIKVYVNGEFAKSFKTVQNYESIKDVTLAPIRYIRFYSPMYVKYGVRGGGRWYIGDYTPNATPRADGVIAVNDEKIIVDNENLVIASEYASDEEFIAAMPEAYVPVYASSIDVDKVEAAYDAAYKAQSFTNVNKIIEEDTTVETAELVGFVVAEDGKLPKLYSLVESGLYLCTLNYNKEYSMAELTYKKYGVVDSPCTFQMIVGAYNSNNQLIELKAAPAQTLGTDAPNGENTITFTPGFSEDVVCETAFYKVFLFNSLTNAIPLMPSAKVGK